jgi:hypothetical protein
MESAISTDKAAKLFGIQGPALHLITADRWYPSSRL